MERGTAIPILKPYFFVGEADDNCSQFQSLVIPFLSLPIGFGLPLNTSNTNTDSICVRRSMLRRRGMVIIRRRTQQSNHNTVC